MGINGLWNVISKQKTFQKRLSVLNGKTVGVDLLIYLFRFITRSDQVVKDFHHDPPIGLTDYIFDFLDDFYSKLTEHNVKMILVLDGLRNPMKSDTNAAREARRLDTEIRWRDLVEQPTQYDLDQVLSLQKQCKKVITYEMIYLVIV
jgi:5'-3' exonuclease